jgi:hypothetical protein
MKEPISEKIPSMHTVLKKLSSRIASDIRVAIPAIVQSFDPITQTITAKVAIRERYINEDLVVSNIEIPILTDVPIVIPRAGGYALTFPIQSGDECLIIFADMCIDAWYSNSGVQNQIESRRHDLSDAFAILGTWSQPRCLQNYSTDSAELRSLNGTAKIKLKGNVIDLIGTVKVNGVDL